MTGDKIYLIFVYKLKQEFRSTCDRKRNYRERNSRVCC